MVRTDGELRSAGAAQGRGADPSADGRDETRKAVFAWSDRTGTDFDSPRTFPWEYKDARAFAECSSDLNAL